MGARHEPVCFDGNAGSCERLHASLVCPPVEFRRRGVRHFFYSIIFYSFKIVFFTTKLALLYDACEGQREKRKEKEGTKRMSAGSPPVGEDMHAVHVDVPVENALAVDVSRGALLCDKLGPERQLLRWVQTRFGCVVRFQVPTQEHIGVLPNHRV